jgi:hypothetical protein
MQQDYPIFYSINKRFGSFCGDSWQTYVAWRGISQVQETVTTDLMLCSSVLADLIDLDWTYNIHENYRTHLFHDADYLSQRVNFDPAIHNLLAIAPNPSSATQIPDHFVFCGYDILDSQDSISVLLNCGSFPSIFTDSELNPFGLLSDRDRVYEIANAIQIAYPEEAHCCDCRVWLISRSDRCTNVSESKGELF